VPIHAARRDTLIQATLARVQSRIDAGASRMTINAPARRWGFSMRMNDLISVAALLLLAGAAIFPMVGAMRNYARTSSCQAGLASAAMGFARYANDYRESLPMASASKAGERWNNVGHPQQSNSANLYTLQRMHYAAMSDLACPGNPGACRAPATPDAMDWKCSEEISYSYQNLFATDRPHWSGDARMIVVADRSPVIVKLLRHEPLIDLAGNSENHDGRGQCVMYNDGSVDWLKSPVLKSGDNIWLPRAVEDWFAKRQEAAAPKPLEGNEMPADRSDTFLSP